MAIQRIQLNKPLLFNGLEDLVNDENRAFAEALINRLNVNFEHLFNDMTDQIVVDSSVLPEIVSGSASIGTKISQTNVEVEQAIIMAAMLDG